MQFFTFAATALLAGTSLASPAVRGTKSQARTDSVHIIFQGAADAAFDQYVPVDGSYNPISNVLSISHIVADGAASNVQCCATGIDGSYTCTVGSQTVDVGPPQTQTSITCKYL